MSRHFSEILAAIRQLVSLKYLNLHTTQAGVISLLQCPVPLSVVLASFSPSLRQISTMQIVFSDFAPLPIRTCPAEETIKTVFLEGLISIDGGETGNLLVWGEKEEGRIKWYRDMESQLDSDLDCMCSSTVSYYL
jgi:hypothetical protein